MRIHLIIAIFCLLLASFLIILIVPVSPYHWVGEFELEQSKIWKVCCEENDCIKQDVQILDTMFDEVWTGIDGETVMLESKRFHPAPTLHTWVCYFNEVRVVNPANIRCILYPDNIPLTMTAD